MSCLSLFQSIEKGKITITLVKTLEGELKKYRLIVLNNKYRLIILT